MRLFDEPEFSIIKLDMSEVVATSPAQGWDEENMESGSDVTEGD